MSLELTEQQQQALESQTESVPRIVNPRTKQTYVLVREDLYERVKELVEGEDLTADEKLLLLAESGRRAGWDDPIMDDYDNYDESRRRLCP